MYNRISDTHDDSSSMKFAKAVLQKDFVILNAEEALYCFLGKNSASFSISFFILIMKRNSLFVAMV